MIFHYFRTPTVEKLPIEVINIFLMYENTCAEKPAHRNEHSSCFIFCFLHCIHRLFQPETQQPEGSGKVGKNSE